MHIKSIIVLQNGKTRIILIISLKKHTRIRKKINYKKIVFTSNKPNPSEYTRTPSNSVCPFWIFFTFLKLISYNMELFGGRLCFTSSAHSELLQNMAHMAFNRCQANIQSLRSPNCFYPNEAAAKTFFTAHFLKP